MPLWGRCGDSEDTMRNYREMMSGACYCSGLRMIWPMGRRAGDQVFTILQVAFTLAPNASSSAGDPGFPSHQETS